MIGHCVCVTTDEWFELVVWIIRGTLPDTYTNPSGSRSDNSDQVPPQRSFENRDRNDAKLSWRSDRHPRHTYGIGLVAAHLYWDYGTAHPGRVLEPMRPPDTPAQEEKQGPFLRASYLLLVSCWSQTRQDPTLKVPTFAEARTAQKLFEVTGPIDGEWFCSGHLCRRFTAGTPAIFRQDFRVAG